ncbi:FecR family protein [Azospirillum thermophilum]|uniref:FecR family protein n=1 Tax=Azospirillum thermophilum TaxID=2202148 RepID=UPI00143E0181|nr:FecR domain-containing protein [Azospirillum thermophilum]
MTDAALDWFVRLLDSPADPATLAAYRSWRQSDPRHAEAFDRLTEVGALPELRSATLAHYPATPLPARPRRRAWLGAMAAALLLAVVGTHLYPDLRVRWSADHRTGTGERRDVVLPDGSRLILDSDSAVALAFTGTERRVALMRGRAYFDVVRDPARPFRVAAGFSTVEVTGTAFTVQSDRREDTVFLEHGRVTVSRLDDPGQPVTLAPGDRLTATALGLTMQHHADRPRRCRGGTAAMPSTTSGSQRWSRRCGAIIPRRSCCWTTTSRRSPSAGTTGWTTRPERWPRWPA